jgi:hypothetical protein
MAKELSQSMLDKLQKMAHRETIFDDDEEAQIDDYAGGNIDDAYNRGSQDGECYLAREILFELGLYEYGEK